MRIPTKYSDFRPKERAALGYLITFSSIAILGYLYQPILTVLMWFSIAIAIGLSIRYISPYYLTWSMGSSMMPSLPLGLTLTIATDRISSVEVGDVVSYRVEDSQNVRHRIIEKTNEGFILKGDGNEVSDPGIVTRDQITNKSIQYGSQPLYIPISPLAIVITFAKIYKKARGEHRDIIESSIDI